MSTDTKGEYRAVVIGKTLSKMGNRPECEAEAIKNQLL
ncbi:hypothetical protein GGQ21_002682 [Salinibacter ruber]|nr:hypothetical protein [Salinibacter ruber]